LEILKGSDDGLYDLELLAFWTLTIIWYSKKLESTPIRKLDLFPSASEGLTTLLGLLQTTNLSQLSSIIIFQHPVALAHHFNCIYSVYNATKSTVS
jgi:hypothetical protein